MTIARGSTVSSYQERLRAIGAYLDEYGVSQVSVIEANGGFLLRAALPPSGERGALLEFAYEDLADRHALLSRRRGRGVMAAAKPRRLSDRYRALEAMYQDLFRALGWELDDSSAHNLLVDEVGSDFLVTYSARHSSNDSEWSKRSVKLGIPELETMLRDARGRRQLPPLQRRLIGAVP